MRNPTLQRRQANAPSATMPRNNKESIVNKLYIHPLPVRIWHWTNAFGCVLLIASGLQIRYLDLFQWMHFQLAVQAHYWIGFIFIANTFIWLGFYLFTDKIKVYHPELSPVKYFRESFRQMQFYGY